MSTDSKRTPLRVLIILIALGIAFRIMPAWREVYPSTGEVRLLEADPWFHARHATIVATHPFHLARFDIATNFPFGERGLNQGLYDLTLGFAAYIVSLGHPTAESVTRVAAWAPIVVTVGVYTTLFLLAQALFFLPCAAIRTTKSGYDVRFTPTRCALLAVALQVFYPGFLLPYSLLGFADHHVIEVLLILLTARGVIAMIEAPLRWNLLAPLPLALFLFTWPGAPVVFLLAIASFLLAGCWMPQAAPASLRYAVMLALLYEVPAWLWPDLIMFAGGHFATGCGLVVLGIAVPGAVWAGHALHGPRRGTAIAVLVAFTGASVFALLSPSGRWAFETLLGPRSPLIREQQPVTLAVWGMATGPLAILGPLGMAWIALRMLGGQESALWSVPLCFGGSMVGLWLWTADFTMRLRAGLPFSVRLRCDFSANGRTSPSMPQWPQLWHLSCWYRSDGCNVRGRPHQKFMGWPSSTTACATRSVGYAITRHRHRSQSTKCTLPLVFMLGPASTAS